MRTESSKRTVPLDVEWAESGFDKVVIEIAKNTAYIKRIIAAEKDSFLIPLKGYTNKELIEGPIMEWKKDILNEDGTFKKNLGNTIKSVV